MVGVIEWPRIEQAWLHTLHTSHFHTPWSRSLYQRLRSPKQTFSKKYRQHRTGRAFKRHTVQALVGFITHSIDVAFESQFVVSSHARVFELIHAPLSGHLPQEENVHWDCWWSEGLYQSVKSFWTRCYYGRTGKTVIGDFKYITTFGGDLHRGHNSGDPVEAIDTIHVHHHFLISAKKNTQLFKILTVCIEKMFDNSCLKGKHRKSYEKECTAP